MKLALFPPVLLCGCLLAGCGSRMQLPAADANAPGWRAETLMHDGVERHYRLYVPESASGPVPLVLLLHGGTQSADALFSRRAGGSQEWSRLADEEGFLLLVPNGTNDATGQGEGEDLSWNDCRPRPPQRRAPEADDVGFIRSLLDETARRLADEPVTVDSSRVFVTGASNGGMMTYRLATELPGRFAAAAAFIANRPDPSECPLDAAPIPMLIVNGTADPLMPYEGGQIHRRRGRVASAESTRDFWIANNRADPGRRAVTELPDRDPRDGSVVVCERYPPASSEGAPVLFCRVQGGGHAMPSIEHQLGRVAERVVGRQNHDVEGARLVWSFFERR